MRKLLVLLSIAALFGSCTKYKDGPTISFRSAEKRLTGKWQIESITLNDADITAAYQTAGLDIFPYSIYRDWSSQYYIGIADTDANVIAKSNLKISHKKDVISFCMVAEETYATVASAIFAQISALNVQTDWEILRLKNDELWIKTKLETNNYEIKFKLIADYSDY